VYRLKGVKPGTTSSIWKEEKQVLASPSVKWGTWLLELLICDAKSVYDLKLFDALVQFLRSPESPMKSRVVRLLTSLLREPKMFPAPGPRVESLQGIMSEVLRECKRRSSASKLFLPSVLLELVELAITARRAQRTLRGDVRSYREPFRSKDEIEPRFEISRPVKESEMKVEDILVAVTDCAEALSHGARLPDDFFCAAWDNSMGALCVLESSHPISSIDSKDWINIASEKLSSDRKLHVRGVRAHVSVYGVA
jgi:hypothetical protein